MTAGGPRPAAAPVLDPRALSSDVFDTLLLRGHESERSRFLRIARRAAVAIGGSVDVSALFRARVEAQHVAYRALNATDPASDIRLADLAEAVAALMGLGSDAARAVANAEIETEIAVLRPNRSLLAHLAEAKARGCRILAISDTYLSEADVGRLLDTLAPGHPIDRIYTSGDRNATKKGGRLFPVVLSAEKLEPGEVLHCGDDAHADHVMPREAGVSARRLPRPAWLIAARKLDGLGIRLRHPVSLT